MDDGQKTANSTLDKPLKELTEDDIAQLTREDCRRFLKEKGMRRPSWNKSQAIQQVISLKALMEGSPGAGDCPVGQRILTKNKTDAENSSTASEELKDSCPYRRRDPVTFAVRDNQQPDKRWNSNRAGDGATAGQMTIFYDGKINVFEGVAPEKARTIMEMAASPGWQSDEATAQVLSRTLVPQFCLPFVGTGGVVAFAAPQVAGIPPVPAIGKVPNRPVDGLYDGRALLETEPVEGSTSRKASVQRYLEKRKDRFKGKKVVVGSGPLSMEMLYLSQKFQCQNPNEPGSGIDKFSTLPQPPGTPARCSSNENRNQKIRLSIDLNGDGGGN